MTIVTGPTSNLPGQWKSIPDGKTYKCDNGCDETAIRILVGDTDSFGSEMYPLCEKCVQETVEGIKEARKEPCQCDWCKTTTTDCVEHRDSDEGTCGPVYMVCEKCRKEENDRAVEELRAMGYDDDDDHW